jgi:hypothetical protein
LHVNGSLLVENPTGSALFFVNSSSGNVGVGTKTPSEKLEVQGRILVASSSQFELQPSDLILDVNGSINSTGSLTASGHGTFGGNGTFGGHGTFGGNGTFGGHGYFGGNLGIGVSPTQKLHVNGSLLVENPTGSALFFVNSSSGNVGVGTKTPSEKLEVQGRILVASSSQFELQPSDLILDVNGSINSTGNGYFAGNVGIGTTSPAVKLHVYSSADENILRLQDSDGTCDANPESTSVTWTCSSDIRLKTNITDAQPILQKLTQLKIREYNVISTGERKTGVIGQEIKEIMPELVKEDENGYLMVSEPNTWQLIKAIQELDSLRKEQQKQIEELKAENEYLKTRLNTIEIKMASLELNCKKLKGD